MEVRWKATVPWLKPRLLEEPGFHSTKKEGVSGPQTLDGWDAALKPKSEKQTHGRQTKLSESQRLRQRPERTGI